MDGDANLHHRKSILLDALLAGPFPSGPVHPVIDSIGNLRTSGTRAVMHMEVVRNGRMPRSGHRFQSVTAAAMKYSRQMTARPYMIGLTSLAFLAPIMHTQ